MVNIKFTDKELECRYCRAMFVFTGKEQQYYLEKGFMKPVRCNECRKVKREIWKEKAKEIKKNQQKFIADMATTTLPAKRPNEKLGILEYVKLEVVPALTPAKVNAEEKIPAKKKNKKPDKVEPARYTPLVINAVSALNWGLA